MRTKRILKAFCLSAALLSMGLTASRAMAACNLFANSLLCYGAVDTSSVAGLAGPVSGSGTDAICTANTASNPCVTSAGITTLNFANGTSSTVGFTGTVASSSGCDAIGQNEPNTKQFCATTSLTVNGPAVSFAAADDNKQCTAKKTPLKCCTGAGAGTCGGNVCVVPDGDFTSCPSGENCMALKAFNKLDNVCPATDFGCEFASNVVAAGVGLYTYGNGPGNTADPLLTGCTQWVQFTANKAITNFAYEPIGPLMGSCGLHGTTMVLRCQGNLQ
jgi:hypothetical protein